MNLIYIKQFIKTVEEFVDYVILLFSVIQVLRRLNSAVMEDNRQEVMAALQSTCLKMQNPVSLAEATLYLRLFKKCLSEKHSDGSELWLEDVEEVAKIVASESAIVESGNYVKSFYFTCTLKVTFHACLKFIKCHITDASITALQ